MQRDTLLLIGRSTGRARQVYEAHADRLRSRGVASEVRTLTYEREPLRELRDELRAVEGERAFAVPLCMAHTRETTDDLPAALGRAPAPVTYCEPVGRNPAVTRAIVDRAAQCVDVPSDAGLVLVGFGASGTPYQRQAAEYHAARLRESDRYAEVTTCFLLQNPTVECARYNVSASETVAVPLFLAPGEATEQRIPAKLEVDRGGVAYADPLADHELVTDAIEAEVEKQRVLVDDGTPQTFEAALTHQSRAVATDGEGPR